MENTYHCYAAAALAKLLADPSMATLIKNLAKNL